MKRRFLLTFMLAITGFVAAFAQTYESSGPFFFMTCSSPQERFVISSYELIEGHYVRLSKPYMRVLEYNGTDFVSKRKIYLKESDIEELCKQLYKKKVWIINGYKPKKAPVAGKPYYLFLYNEYYDIEASFANLKENKKAAEIYQIINDFCVKMKNENPPKQYADLIYASCAATHHGGLGKDYFEMIADPGVEPKVVAVHKFDTPEYTKNEYSITAQDVKGVQEELYKVDLEKIRDYNRDDEMTGGTTYRVYMEFADGDKINATWFTHEPRKEAVQAYAIIERQLSKLAEENSKKANNDNSKKANNYKGKKVKYFKGEKVKK